MRSTRVHMATFRSHSNPDSPAPPPGRPIPGAGPGVSTPRTPNSSPPNRRTPNSGSSSTTHNNNYPAIVYERFVGAASAPLPAQYRRREPEKTAFYNVIRQNLETFLEQARIETEGQGYPHFVEREFRRFLDCGQLSRGFARLRCPDCGYERLVAFSCKCHICPSCQARRMSDTAAFLTDHLLPPAPYRQWVLSFPWPMRLALAYDKILLSKTLAAFLRAVFAWQRRRGRAAGINDGQTGAVSFIQRMGGALNLNPHIHSIQPDGLWIPDHGDDAEDGRPLAFVELPPPTDDDIRRLTRSIARRLTRIAKRHLAERMGHLMEVDAQHPVDNGEAAVVNALSASLRAPIRFAAATPLPGRELELVPPGTSRPAVPHAQPPNAQPLCASENGYSLHAGTAIAEHDRDALERLCRYGLRAPFSVERFSLRPDGKVRYELRRPWPNPAGATELTLKPLELLRRLAASIPTPYTNLVRYHSVFANRSRFRKRLPLPPPSPHAHGHTVGATTDSTTASATQPSMTLMPLATRPPPPPPPRPPRSWGAVLKTVFKNDAVRGEKCATQMVVLAFLSDPNVVSKILLHLGLPNAPPHVPAARVDTDFFEGPTDPQTELFGDDTWSNPPPSTTPDARHAGRGPRAPP